MVYINGRSPAEISRELAVFVSNFVSPPIVAIAATVCFSLWSPIGLGFLDPSWSILICFALFAFFPFLPVLYFLSMKECTNYCILMQLKISGMPLSY